MCGADAERDVDPSLGVVAAVEVDDDEGPLAALAVEVVLVVVVVD